MTPSRKAGTRKPPEVTSVDDLFSVARAMERETAARYEQLARLMERYGNSRVAELFRTLAEEEREHESDILRWAKRLGRRAAPAVDFRWEIPEALDQKALEEAGGPYLLTPHRALCLAVANEERAFAFFVDVAAMAPDPEVRAYAEVLAKDELDHITRLRLERRRAYRAERQAARPRARPPVSSLPELLATARAMEARGGEEDAAMAEALEAAGADPETAGLLRRLAEEERRHAAELAAEAAGPDAAGGDLGAVDTDLEPPSTAEGPPGAPLEALRAALERAEDGFEFYAAVAEKSTDEAVVRRAQVLAEKMVGRLALISGRISELVPGSDPAA